MHIKFARVSERAKLPDRAHPTDAGADVFACIDEEIVIMPNTCAVIPTGLKAEVPPGYMLEIKNRSSVAAKRGLIVGACVIDSGYSGEIFVNLHNVGAMPQKIPHLDKIAQAVLIPVVHFHPMECAEEELYENLIVSSRGDGALGSTDNKEKN